MLLGKRNHAKKGLFGNDDKNCANPAFYENNLYVSEKVGVIFNRTHLKKQTIRKKH